MLAFAALYDALDASTSLIDKRRALVEGLAAMPPHDAAWAVHLLAGGRLGGKAGVIARRRRVTSACWSA